MKTIVIAGTLIASTLGFATLATAQDRDGRDRAERIEQRQERRAERVVRQDRREDRAYRQGYQAGTWQQPRAVYTQPGYAYTQPAYNHGYGYNTPRYYGNTVRFARGGYLPYEYRQHGYYVSNWNSHPHLYAPPHGHQWMHVGNDYLLVALATGLIANLLTR